MPARFPAWQSEVRAAISEADPEKLLSRVHAAEVAIFTRLQELGQGAIKDAANQAERELLATAVETLRLLKRDRLGFPDWTPK
ncbi:MAG TPA: hypothetical protein VMP68_20120 [Candidatus Eisenbacteria bacterium]|nr:hypothetical protein [Candidatus Eisenbacteria bacterium]